MADPTPMPTDTRGASQGEGASVAAVQEEEEDDASLTSGSSAVSVSPSVSAVTSPSSRMKVCPACQTRCAVARKLCTQPTCNHRFVTKGTPTSAPTRRPRHTSPAPMPTLLLENSALPLVPLPPIESSPAPVPLADSVDVELPSLGVQISPPSPPRAIPASSDDPPTVKRRRPARSPDRVVRRRRAQLPPKPATDDATATPAAAATATTALPPAAGPLPTKRPSLGRPVGWRRTNTAEQNAALIAAAVAARRAFDEAHGLKPPGSPLRKPQAGPTGGPGRKTTASLPVDPAAAAAAAAASAEIAALVGQIENAWLRLEFNMMHRPLNDAPAASADAKPATDAAADPSKDIYMDAAERKDLLEHVELLKERRKFDGGKGSGYGKSSRVGPRYQCSMPSTVPPPLTPELWLQLNAEPYDYERFTRDEHPVPMGDFDLQEQLVKASTGFPTYPLDEDYRARIGGFIMRRRERKRKEDERRSQQSIQQQIQEVRAGFSFQSFDVSRKPHGNSHAATNNAPNGSNTRRSHSPPVNPLDSYGSVTTKDISDVDGVDSLESKRRSSRITPSLVVKRIRGPAAPVAAAASADVASSSSLSSPPTSTLGTGLPSALDQYAQLAADKRNARDQAEADRKLALKLQAFYEREQTAKQPRKPNAKREHLAVAKETAARSEALAQSGLSISSLLPISQFPPSSLASLPPPAATFSTAPITPAAVKTKRKRRPSSSPSPPTDATEMKQPSGKLRAAERREAITVASHSAGPIMVPASSGRARKKATAVASSLTPTPAAVAHQMFIASAMLNNAMFGGAFQPGAGLPILDLPSLPPVPILAPMPGAAAAFDSPPSSSSPIPPLVPILPPMQLSPAVDDTERPVGRGDSATKAKRAASRSPSPPAAKTNARTTNNNSAHKKAMKSTT